MSTEENRKCNVCHTTQPLSCFFRNNKSLKSCNECAFKNKQRYFDGKIKTTKTKEEKKLYNKMYYDKHKEKLKITITENNNRLRLIRKICVCGSFYTLANKSAHFQTKKHKNFMEAEAEAKEAEAEADKELHTMCDCGVNILTRSLKKHLESKTHKLRLEFVNQNK